MVVCEHPSRSIEEFQDALHQDDFILVEEWQRQPDGRLQNEGKMLINQQLIGKVRTYRPEQGNQKWNTEIL